jgi:hypothetical protein
MKFFAIRHLVLIGAVLVLNSTMSASTWYSDLDDDAVFLQFESLFPDSPYKKVVRACFDMWQEIHAVEGKELEDGHMLRMNESFIDHLITLHTRIGCMLKKANACSRDDLEYLMGMLHRIHLDYSDRVGSYKTPETVCSHVLLDRIKNRLEMVLE